MEGDEEPPAAAAMVSVLTDDLLLPFILKRLCPRDLVRAALANKRWRRAAALAVPRAPPLVGYLLHPEKIRSAQIPPVFVPSDASSPRLSLPLAPDDLSGLSVHDIDQGLVILLPCELPEIRLLRILVLDPASGRRALLPPPPRDALPDDQWRQTRRIIGAAVLSRAHPSKMEFQAVCVTIDDDRPRAWVAFVNGDDCVWCVLPRSNSKQTREQFDPNSCGKCCLHDQGQIYWLASDSTYLLALDPPSLEFRFIPASPHLGPQFNNYGIAPVDVFCYYLCWPPAFLATLEKHDDALIENLMILVRIAFYNISYIRGLFSEEFFSDMPLLPTGMQIKKLIPMDDESQRLADWLEKGVYDALRKKFLKTIIFSVYDENGPLLEEYCLSFTYCKEITMDLRLTGSTESIWTLRSDAAESFVNQIWISACSMVQQCFSFMSGWGKIPEERAITMRLLYFDNQTPLEYEPPFFERDDDVRKCCPLPLQTTFPDYFSRLHTHDVKSVLSNNPCLSNQDFALDPDSKIQQGHLFCITKKKVTFYFDSGASHHICGDKQLIQNLHVVPTEHQKVVHDAEDEALHLCSAGEVVYDQIKLSPVFHHSALKYNTISLGELDDSNTLMYLGDKRIKIFDVNRGEMIGEGYLHEKRNEYIVRSIICRKNEQVITKSMLSSIAIDEKTEWAIDSLCCNHMTGMKELISDTRDEKRPLITPKGTFESSEIGNVKTSTVTLFNVLYCPGLRHNLISEGQLDRDGYSCTRLAHKCKIQWRGTQEIVGVAHQDENSLYYVEYFHSVSDPSLKHPRNDRECIQKLKRPRQDGSSLSTCRKRTA